MQTVKKQVAWVGLVATQGLALGVLVATLTGCVVDPAPRSYYRSYPNDYAYRDYSQPYYSPGSVTLEYNEYNNRPAPHDRDWHDNRGPDHRDDPRNDHDNRGDHDGHDDNDHDRGDHWR